MSSHQAVHIQKNDLSVFMALHFNGFSILQATVAAGPGPGGHFSTRLAATRVPGPGVHLAASGQGLLWAAFGSFQLCVCVSKHRDGSKAGILVLFGAQELPA